MSTTEQEVCACGHDKSTHFAETESSGDVHQARRVVWMRCTGRFCECRRYRRPDVPRT